MDAQQSENVRSSRFVEIVEKPFSNLLKNGIVYILITSIVVSFIILMLPVQQKVKFCTPLYSNSGQIIKATTSGCFLEANSKTYVETGEVIGFLVANDSIVKICSPDSGLLSPLVKNNQMVNGNEAIFILKKPNSVYFFDITLPQSCCKFFSLKDTLVFTTNEINFKGVVDEFNPKSGSVRVKLITNFLKDFDSNYVLIGSYTCNKVRFYKLLL